MLATLQPNGIFDVILWPFILSVVGVGIWALGMKLEYDDGPRWVKWIGIVPLLIGLIKGWPWFRQFTDGSAIGIMYREGVPGGRMLIAHYGAVVLPLLGLIAIGIWYMADRKNR